MPSLSCYPVPTSTSPILSHSSPQSKIFCISGDIELNPGPTIYKFPCEICAKLVKSNQKGLQLVLFKLAKNLQHYKLQCDEYKWYHIACK